MLTPGPCTRPEWRLVQRATGAMAPDPILTECRSGTDTGPETRERWKPDGQSDSEGRAGLWTRALGSAPHGRPQ